MSGQAVTTPMPSKPSSGRPDTGSPGAAKGRPDSRNAKSRSCAFSPVGYQQGDRQQLVISPKTVANHIEHIYTKIDVSNRAGAGLFAMQHGLLPEEHFPAAVGAESPVTP
jgi:hypothetical protein